MAGHFYALSNKSYRGLLKLGYVVGRHPEERAKELSCSTAVPTPFEVAYCYGCDDPRRLEAIIHRQFARRRVRRQREFFRVSVTEVQDYVENLFPPQARPSRASQPHHDRMRLSPVEPRLAEEIRRAGGLINWVRSVRDALDRE